MTHVSPSQVETWRMCQRKWSYSRVRPRTENKYAAFGTRAHAIAEAWLEHRTPPPDTAEGRCIAAGLQAGLLPMPQTPGLILEHGWTFEHDGVTYLGRIDMLYGYDPGRCVVIGDHKTTGDLSWMKTGERFATDPQRIIYSAWACIELSVQWVVAHWVYYRRRPPLAKPSIMAESKAEILERFHEIHETAGKPIVAAAGKPPETFPRSLDACGAFGGCPHKAECLADMSPIAIAAASLVQIQLGK